MSDLIEREDAIKDFADYLREADLLKCDGTLYPTEHYLKKAERHMKRIPSADRPKGEWISIIEVNDFGEPYQASIYCSECGKTFGHEANFCPYCGADMRESRERRE